MKYLSIKDIKKGDTFYEKVGLHNYCYEALEGCKEKGEIEIMGKLCKQYII